MKCPKCGQELTISKKDPSYALCYGCRKKYKLPEKYLKKKETEPADDAGDIYDEKTKDMSDDEQSTPVKESGKASRPVRKPEPQPSDEYEDDDDYDDDYEDDYDDDYDDEDDDDYDDDEDDYDDRSRGRSRSSRNAAKSGPGKHTRKPRRRKKKHGFLKFLLTLIVIVILLAAAALGLYKLDILPEPLYGMVDTLVSDHLDFLANDSSDSDDASADTSDADGSSEISASFEDLLQYMEDSGVISGESSDAYPDVIGALNGVKYIDSNVEFYEFDTSSERYQEATSESSIGGMEVAAVNGPFVLIFDTEDQSADIINTFMAYSSGDAGSQTSDDTADTTTDTAEDAEATDDADTTE